MITTMDDGTKIVQCGYGTVGTAGIKRIDSVVLLLSEIAQVPIGSSDYEEAEDHQVEIWFHNVEAINAWITMLERSKAALQSAAL